MLNLQRRAGADAYWHLLPTASIAALKPLRHVAVDARVHSVELVHSGGGVHAAAALGTDAGGAVVHGENRDAATAFDDVICAAIVCGPYAGERIEAVFDATSFAPRERDQQRDETQGVSYQIRPA